MPTTATRHERDVPAARAGAAPSAAGPAAVRAAAQDGHPDAPGRDRHDGALHGRRLRRPAGRRHRAGRAPTGGRASRPAGRRRTTSRRRRAGRSRPARRPVPSAAEPVAGSSSQLQVAGEDAGVGGRRRGVPGEHRDALPHAERRRAPPCRAPPRSTAPGLHGQVGERQAAAGQVRGHPGDVGRRQPHRRRRAPPGAGPRPRVGLPPVSVGAVVVDDQVEHPDAALLAHRAGGQPAGAHQRVGRADARVPGEGQLGERREDPHPVVGAGLGGRAEERRLRQVELERRAPGTARWSGRRRRTPRPADCLRRPAGRTRRRPRTPASPGPPRRRR